MINGILKMALKKLLKKLEGKGIKKFVVVCEIDPETETGISITDFRVHNPRTNKFEKMDFEKMDIEL